MSSNSLPRLTTPPDARHQLAQRRGAVVDGHHHRHARRQRLGGRVGSGSQPWSDDLSAVPSPRQTVASATVSPLAHRNPSSCERYMNIRLGVPAVASVVDRGCLPTARSAHPHSRPARGRFAGCSSRRDPIVNQCFSFAHLFEQCPAVELERPGPGEKTRRSAIIMPGRVSFMYESRSGRSAALAPQYGLEPAEVSRNSRAGPA
jgi:hypothetical protein